MGNRPDFKQIKEMLSHAAAIDSTMKNALTEGNAEISNVRKAAENFFITIPIWIMCGNLPVSTGSNCLKSMPEKKLRVFP